MKYGLLPSGGTILIKHNLGCNLRLLLSALFVIVSFTYLLSVHKVLEMCKMSLVL